MPIVLARVDQRLIHGITVNEWNATLKPKRFMVIDDAISKDDVVKSGMRMSKPAGTGMSIIDMDKAVGNFKKGNYDEQKVFLIVKEPGTILSLIDQGIAVPEVNVGFVFPGDDRVAVTPRISLDQREVDDLRQIAATGVPVTFQYRPQDHKEKLEDVLRGKF